MFGFFKQQLFPFSNTIYSIAKCKRNAAPKRVNEAYHGQIFTSIICSYITRRYMKCLHRQLNHQLYITIFKRESLILTASFHVAYGVCTCPTRDPTLWAKGANKQRHQIRPVYVIYLNAAVQYYTLYVMGIAGLMSHLWQLKPAKNRSMAISWSSMWLL